VLADEIVVTVQHESHCWDILASFEVAPTGIADGEVCGLCDPSNRAVYPTRRALFVEHVFQPFAEWVERKLAPTRALGFGGSIGDGSTWVVLLSGKDCRGYSVVLPLWPPRPGGFQSPSIHTLVAGPAGGHVMHHVVISIAPIGHPKGHAPFASIA